MVNAVSRTFPLNLMMKSMHFQVKKRLSFELQNVAVGLSSAAGLSAYPPLSTLSAKENLIEHQDQRPCAKRDINALSVAGAFSQAKFEIGAKPNFTYSR